jgi:uracil-DNA glycosylase
MNHRDAYLIEMGLGPLWRVREGVESRESRVESEQQNVVAPVATEQSVNHAEGAAPTPLSVGAAPSPRLATPDSRLSAISNMEWPALKTAVAECRACDLCKARKQAVLGVGDTQADWLFVGEGPGAEEDERGEPFVGQAGKLLDAMLAAIDLKRGEDVYIANAVKCRPPNNRTPEPDETAACWPYLQRQIDLLQPKLIVALGRPAAQTLLQTEIKISASRGKLFDYRGIPVIVMYHPAYLLRTLQDKARAWEDLVFARTTMRGLKEKS